MSRPNYPIIWIMRYLLFILALPLFVQAATKEQQCDRLKVVASQLEKMIQTKAVKQGCTGLTASKYSGFDYRCKDLAAVEMQLKSIHNELAMLKGISALKDEAIAAKATLEKPENRNKAAAVDASHRLYNDLKIASTIEQFLKTKGLKNENLMTLLAKAKDDDFKDGKKLSDLIASTCTKIGFVKGKSPVCDNPQDIGPEMLQEIDGLLKLARKTERKFDEPQIKDVLEALAIKDGEKEYSFTQMLSEVSAPKPNEAFSGKDMQVLSSIKLNDNNIEKYTFLKNLSKSSRDLAATKDLTKAMEMPTRYLDLFDSLKRREEWDLKSKLSVVLNELKDNIPANAQEACKQTRALNGGADECLNALAKNLIPGSTQQKSAENILLELKYGQAHIEKLDKVIKDCTPSEEEMELSEDCLKHIAKISVRTTELDAKANELDVIRAEILKESKGLIASRDLAVKTLMDKQCMNRSEIHIPCEDPTLKISKEAVALSDATGEIITIWEKSTVVEEGLCKTPPEGSKHIDEICKIAQTKVDGDGTERKNRVANNDNYIGPTEAPSNGRSSGQGWADLLGGLAQAAGTYFTPSQQYINPYASMYQYSPMAGQPMDIKNKIMDPYMVTGFGSYSTTPGLRPYSSVNSNVGMASAYSFGSSTFFNSPVGW